MIKLERTKYIIVRKVDGAVMCDSMNKSVFLPMKTIDTQIVKLYRSPATALMAAESAGCNRDSVYAESANVQVELQNAITE